MSTRATHHTVELVVLLSLLPGSPPGRADVTDLAADQPVEDLAHEQLEEGLRAALADSTTERVDGALEVAMYAPFVAEDAADDDEEEGSGPSDYEASVSSRIRVWLDGESEPWVRFYLVQALVRLDDEADVPYILDLLSGDDPTLRRLAAATAKRHPSEEAERLLVSRYPKQSYWWVKTAFLEAMSAQEGDRCLETLHQALADPSREVRAAASDALGLRADPRSVEPLLEAMRSDDSTGADAAAAALARIESITVVPALAFALGSPYPFVRQSAAVGLGKFSSDDNVMLLAAALHDQDQGVAVMAAQSLIEFHTKAAAVQVLLHVATYAPDQMDQLLDGGDLTFESLRWSPRPGIDFAAACDELFANPEIPAWQAAGLHAIARELRRRESEDRSVRYHSAVAPRNVHYRRNPDARDVMPAKGDGNAAGWRDAPYEVNGGTSESVKRGTRVTIDDAAFYDGSTWLHVCDVPFDSCLWMLEADLATVRSDS